MKFFIEVAVEIDPNKWEEAGYDPLDQSLHVVREQVKEWAQASQMMGSESVKAKVHSVRLGSEPRPLNSAHFGFHVMTLSRDAFGPMIFAEDADGELLAQADSGEESWADLVEKGFRSVP